MNKYNLEYFYNNKNLKIVGDNTGQNIIYLYANQREIIVSSNESLFFNELRTLKKLKLNYENLSFLILNNVIPYPFSMYENVYLLSIGDSVKFTLEEDKIIVNFDFKFPYIEHQSREDSESDSETLLNLLTKSVENIDNNSLLSLSSGKDSTAILLALNNCDKKINTFTYKSPGDSDETDYITSLTNKLGFKNTIFELKEDLKMFSNNLNIFYSNINILNVDQAQLAYLFVPEYEYFNNANIIDGSGNDIYFGHVPSKEQYYINYLSLVNINKNMIKFQHKLNFPQGKSQGFLFKSQAANNGLYTWFTYNELQDIYSKGFDTSNYWLNYEKNYNKSNYHDYRAISRGRFLDTEVFMRKARNFAQVVNSNIYFPWASVEIIDFVFNLESDQRFDKKKFTNKVLLRKLLSEKLNYNLPKKGFEFDALKFLVSYKDIIIKEIISCKLWNEKIVKLLESYYYCIENNKNVYVMKRKIQLIFQISAFINRNEDIL